MPAVPTRLRFATLALAVTALASVVASPTASAQHPGSEFYAPDVRSFPGLCGYTNAAEAAPPAVRVRCDEVTFEEWGGGHVAVSFTEREDRAVTFFGTSDLYKTNGVLAIDELETPQLGRVAAKGTCDIQRDKSRLSAVICSARTRAGVLVAHYYPANS